MTKTSVTLQVGRTFPNVSDMPLSTDLQYHEPYTSGGINRKLRGIILPGVYDGFEVQTGGGLSILITSDNAESGLGIASVNIGEYQITVAQRANIRLNATPGTTVAVVLRAYYAIGSETSQVNSNSKTPPSTITLQTYSGNLLLEEGELLLGVVTIPKGTSAITTSMIDTTQRKTVRQVYALTDRTDLPSSTVAASAKALFTLVKSLETDFAATGNNNDIKSLKALETIYSAVSFEQNATFEKDVDIDGALSVEKSLAVEGKITGKSGLEVKGSSKLDGDTEVTGTLTVDKTSTFKDEVTLEKTVTAEGDINVEGTVAIAEELSVDGKSSFNEDVTLEKGLNAKGNIETEGELHAQGNTILGSTLDVAGKATFESEIDAQSVSAKDITASEKMTTPSLVLGKSTLEGAASFLDINDKASSKVITADIFSQLLPVVAMSTNGYMFIPSLDGKNLQKLLVQWQTVNVTVAELMASNIYHGFTYATLNRRFKIVLGCVGSICSQPAGLYLPTATFVPTVDNVACQVQGMALDSSVIPITVTVKYFVFGYQ